MYEEKFTPDPQMLKMRATLQKKKEALLFLSLCPQSDISKVIKNGNLTVEDFERISYLLDQLGLQNYRFSFENRHPDLLHELGSQIENKVNSGNVDIADELRQRELWNQEFLRQLPTERMQTCFKKIFDLSL